MKNIYNSEGKLIYNESPDQKEHNEKEPSTSTDEHPGEEIQIEKNEHHENETPPANGSISNNNILLSDNHHNEKSNDLIDDLTSDPQSISVSTYDTKINSDDLNSNYNNSELSRSNKRKLSFTSKIILECSIVLLVVLKITIKTMSRMGL